MKTQRRRPWLAMLIGIVVLGGIPSAVPWAFHMGGRWTPLLTWTETGQLVTKGGVAYPLFVMLYPSPHFSKLHLDSERPTGGVQGSACLCTGSGESQYLKLSGTIYNTWKSTEGSLMALRLLELTILDVGQKRAGFFDLMGRWEGPELVMEDRGAWSHPFRSGLRIEHASVRLRWRPFWNCRTECASATPGKARP